MRADTQGNVSLEETFNYAMADWGESGNPSEARFKEVLRRRYERNQVDPNSLQCLALCYCVAGNKEQALQLLMESRKSMAARNEATFSAWRYLDVQPTQFLEDLNSLERMINGEKVKPLVLQDVRLQ